MTLVDILLFIMQVLINRGLMYFAQKDYRNAKADFSQAAKVRILL